MTENDELIRQDVSLIFEVVKNKLEAFFLKEKAKGRLAKKANDLPSRPGVEQAYTNPLPSKAAPARQRIVSGA